MEFMLHKENKTIQLTESELHSLIEGCIKEILAETGGFSLGVAKRGLRDYQRAKSNKINFICSPHGTTYDVDNRVVTNKVTVKTARENLLSYFADSPFVFTTDLEHSNTHIIEYKVQNIVAIRNNEVLLEGEWYDTDDGERMTKRIKVNCDTKSVMYYSPILRSNHAQLDFNTSTKLKWESLVKELIKLRDEYRK